MIIKRLTLICIAAAGCLLPLKAQTPEQVDSVWQELAKARNAHDSVPIYFNLIDCAKKGEHAKILEDAYQNAIRANDDQAKFSLLDIMVGMYRDNDSLQQVLIDRVMAIEPSEQQRVELLFLKVRAAGYHIRQLPEDERQRKLVDLVAETKSHSDVDVYKRVERLGILLHYLRYETRGDMMTKYLKELEEAIDRLPVRHLLLSAMVYTEGAYHFLNNRMYEEAVQMVHKTLEINREFDKMHALQGRKFRNYDRTLRDCNINLIKCYSVIPPEEVEASYNKIKSLKWVKERPEYMDRVNAYYYVATGRYAEAIPLLKEEIPKNKLAPQRLLAITFLVEAAQKVGDRENILYALSLYSDALETLVKEGSEESYRELQILYDVNGLKERNDNLEAENRDLLAKRQHWFIVWLTVAVLAISLLFAVTFIYYRRSRAMANQLAESNTLLTAERNTLKETQRNLIKARDNERAANNIKDDFVNNLSREIRTPLSAVVEYSSLLSDCAEAESRPYMKRFADLISLNSDLLLALVNDVLNLPSLEKAKLSVHISHCSIREVCKLALDNVRKRVGRGVELVFANEGDPDSVIQTDFNRVEQVLNNLLSNAAKFTQEGTITLAYSIAPDHSTATFTVTDTGIGIPQGKEEQIFGRFEKIHSDTQGNGLGLYISRLLAQLLKGEVHLDTTYKTGSRFVFTIPIK